jgi:hypothetical protein
LRGSRWTHRRRGFARRLLERRRSSVAGTLDSDEEK